MTMQAIVISKPGSPEVLELATRQIPQPLATEVLVKVAASGINRPDVAQRKGHYPAPPGASVDIPGLEIAGVITQVGAAVSRWQVGDRVCGLVSGGGYAEYCVIPEGQCLPIPGGLSLIEAASLPETFFTVWSNVFDRAALQPGENLLIHGGSSGIGVTAIQMANALGCTVYVTAGTEAKCSFCEQLGAKKAINYKTEVFAEALASSTAGHGVDVILDMIGAAYMTDNLKCLADDGRLVMINSMKGKEATINLVEVMRRRLTITGSTLRPRDVAFKTAIAQKLEAIIWPLLANGQIKPVIYRVFKATQAAEAHSLLESSEHIGKIVIDWA